VGRFLPANTPVSARLHASQNAFAMIAGGGVDIKLSKHMAFRPIKFDYYQTRFSDLELGANTQKNRRYTAGASTSRLAQNRRSIRTSAD
jgi:hypothetical protein